MIRFARASHAFTLSGGWLMVLIGIMICSCDRAAHSTSTNPLRVNQATTATRESGLKQGPESNPFLSRPAVRSPSPMTHCVRVVLRINDGHANAALTGAIEIHNRCDARVAVLTSPVEVRTRTQPGDLLPWEGMLGPFASLSIYRRELGRPDIVTDAGAIVLGLPDFIVVEQDSSAKLLITGDQSHRLKRGAYGAFFRTWAVFTDLPPSFKGEIDLAKSLSRHNVRHAGTDPLPPARSFVPLESGDSLFSVE